MLRTSRCFLLAAAVSSSQFVSLTSSSSPAAVASASSPSPKQHHHHHQQQQQQQPVRVKPASIATWKFGSIAVSRASQLLHKGVSALDAVERGINAVELDTQAQYYVGVGGLPNAEGVMEFDAALMDHDKRYSAVLCLTDVSTPVSVARSILDHSMHNVLSGKGALDWALRHGFSKSKVLTDGSEREWLEWKKANAAVAGSVGGESAGKSVSLSGTKDDNDSDPPHDTVGIICIDSQGRLACGTSTSGWKFKHAGRVGDSALPGAGLYCDGEVGAAVCTGDGEEIQRQSLAFLVVELMRQGLGPGAACSEAIKRLGKLKPKHDATKGDSMYSALTVAVIAMDPQGRTGAASTLGPTNLHRGAGSFPAMCWRESDGEGAPASLHQLDASFEGAEW